MNEQLSLIQRFRKTVIGEYAEALIWAVALALVLTTFVVQAFKIPSGSMLETLQIGDHLLVNKFLYGLRNPFNDDYLIRGVEPRSGTSSCSVTPRIGARLHQAHCGRSRRHAGDAEQGIVPQRR